MVSNCRIYPKYSDRKASANSGDPDKTASDQVLRCLSLIRLIVNISARATMDIYEFRTSMVSHNGVRIHRVIQGIM